MTLEVGQAAEVSRSFGRPDVEGYVALGGHVPAEGGVPEPLIGALFSYLLGVRLPGNGTKYLKQDTDFAAPARVGETLTARVEITRIRPDKHLVDLRTSCLNARGELIADGRALVHVKDVAP